MSEEGLRRVVREVEQYVGRSGWDQPPRLFALAPTKELAAAEPELAVQLGLRVADAGPLTPVEQEIDHEAGRFEDLVERIEFPAQVHGALAVVERVVLPPGAEQQVPDDAAHAAAFAAEHPQRTDVRMAVGVLRSGTAHCALRMRSHDEDTAVLQGPDLVPGLAAALHETLEGQPRRARPDGDDVTDDEGDR